MNSFFFGLLMAHMYLLLQGAKIKIEPAYRPFFVKAGTSYELTCILEDTKGGEISWLMDSLPPTDAGYSIKNSTGTASGRSAVTVWREKATSSEPSLIYCTSEGVEEAISVYAFEVYVKHSNVSEGADVSIDCRPEITYEQVTVTWSRAGKDIHNHMDRYVLQNNNRTLIVRASTPQDAGEFMCSITFVAGMNLTQSFQQSVSLSGKPYFTEQKSNEIRVNLNDTLDLACPVSGYPVPEVYWLRKGDSPVVGSDREVLDSYGGVSEARLRIANVTSLDLGQYTCAAENANGRIVKEFWVQLVGSAVSEHTRGVVSLVLSLFLTLWVMETP